MEITIDEFRRLADDKTSLAVKIAELERQLAAKSSENERLKCRVSALEAENTSARLEIMMLRNYIILSVEKIKAFAKQLTSIDRFAFLKTFLECSLPKEHYQEQLLLVNEMMTIPEEPKPAVPVTNNHFEPGSGCQVFNGSVSGKFDKN